MRLVSPNGVEIEAPAEVAKQMLGRGFRKAAPKRTKKKAQLVDEATAEMTNAELAEAIDAAKKSPAKPRRKRAE